MRKVEPLAVQTQLSPLIIVAMLAWQPIVEADTRATAAQLAAQLDARALNAFAAEDPNDSGRFVAALYIGGHLLAISAVHPAPVFLRREITGGNYRHVYSMLSTSANRHGRLFVEDFGELGLGLSRDPTGFCDITWRDSQRETMFDGNWRAQELSEAEYHLRFASDEAEYAEMLQVLGTELQQRGVPEGQAKIPETSEVTPMDHDAGAAAVRAAANSEPLGRPRRERQ